MKNLIASYKQKRWLNIFAIYLRFLLGGAFVFSAMPKVMGERFLSANCETMPINTFPHWFETLYRSGIYWEFLGWGQLLAALLLMTQLFATLGAVAFLPIILNVFFISITYELGIGLPIIAGLLVLGNTFLLLWDYNKLYILLTPDSKNELKIENQYNEFFNHVFWAYLGATIFATTVIYVLIYDRNPTAWFFICVAEGLAGFIYMNIKFRKHSISQN